MGYDVWCRFGRLNRVATFDAACEILCLLRGRGVTVWLTCVEG